jgi:hypothetical protein
MRVLDFVADFRILKFDNLFEFRGFSEELAMRRAM